MHTANTKPRHVQVADNPDAAVARRAAVQLCARCGVHLSPHSLNRCALCASTKTDDESVYLREQIFRLCTIHSALQPFSSLPGSVEVIKLSRRSQRRCSASLNQQLSQVQLNKVAIVRNCKVWNLDFEALGRERTRLALPNSCLMPCLPARTCLLSILCCCCCVRDCSCTAQPPDCTCIVCCDRSASTATSSRLCRSQQPSRWQILRRQTCFGCSSNGYQEGQHLQGHCERPPVSFHQDLAGCSCRVTVGPLMLLLSNIRGSRGQGSCCSP